MLRGSQETGIAEGETQLGRRVPVSQVPDDQTQSPQDLYPVDRPLPFLVCVVAPVLQLSVQNLHLNSQVYCYSEYWQSWVVPSVQSNFTVISSHTYLGRKILPLKQIYLNCLRELFVCRIVFHPLTLSLCLFWLFRCISCRQQNVEFSFWIHFATVLCKLLAWCHGFLCHFSVEVCCAFRGLSCLTEAPLAHLLSFVLSLWSSWAIVYPWNSVLFLRVGVKV